MKRLRRHTATALTIAATVWPAVTFALQSVWHVDPWKLVSFGMYATPVRDGGELEVEVLISRPQGYSGEVVLLGGKPYVRIAPPTAAVALEARRFISRRQSLGELATPDGVGMGVVHATGAAAAVVGVTTFELDASSALVRRRSAWFRYTAGGLETSATQVQE